MRLGGINKILRFFNFNSPFYSSTVNDFRLTYVLFAFVFESIRLATSPMFLKIFKIFFVTLCLKYQLF